MRLWPIPKAEAPTLWPIYESYMPALCPDQGINSWDRYFDLYWQEPEHRFPYWFGRSHAQGFALVRDTGENDRAFEMAEFCVLQDARRQGVDTAVLPLIFARHPGRWRSSVLMANRVGLAFWPGALQRAGVQDLRHSKNARARDYRFAA